MSRQNSIRPQINRKPNTHQQCCWGFRSFGSRRSVNGWKDRIIYCSRVTTQTNSIHKLYGCVNLKTHTAVFLFIKNILTKADYFIRHISVRNMGSIFSPRVHMPTTFPFGTKSDGRTKLCTWPVEQSGSLEHSLNPSTTSKLIWSNKLTCVCDIRST